MKELGEGSFSIAAFYVRRAKRIVPAVTALLVVATTVAEWHKLAMSRALDVGMAKLAKTGGEVPYISYFDTLCRGQACVEYAGVVVPLQGDASHFTGEGSIVFAQRLKAEHALD